MQKSCESRTLPRRSDSTVVTLLYLYFIRIEVDVREARMVTELQLGPRIRSLRQARRLTLREVSQRAGVTESFLSQVERDVTSPSIATVQRIARALDLSIAQLFAEDMMGDDLDAWLAESSLMKRSFRNAAIIAGLIERRMPGKEKTARQMTVNTDLIYDVLRSHQPDHILLRAAWDDAAGGLIDAHRLGAMLKRIRGQIIHRALDTVSPLAVPVLLDIGRESVYGEGHDALLAEAANQLIDEAMRLV